MHWIVVCINEMGKVTRVVNQDSFRTKTLHNKVPSIVFQCCFVSRNRTNVKVTGNALRSHHLVQIIIRLRSCSSFRTFFTFRSTCCRTAQCSSTSCTFFFRLTNHCLCSSAKRRSRCCAKGLGVDLGVGTGVVSLDLDLLDTDVAGP